MQARGGGKALKDLFLQATPVVTVRYRRKESQRGHRPLQSATVLTLRYAGKGRKSDGRPFAVPRCLDTKGTQARDPKGMTKPLTLRVLKQGTRKG